MKACFDVAGWTTHAGSAVLADAPPAAADAPMVAALRRAGTILLAQTEHDRVRLRRARPQRTYGTPTTPLLTDAPRVGGGSTSGGAVAVALGAADVVARLRHQRLDPHPRRVLRRRRLQAVAGSLPGGRVDPAGHELRRARHHRPHGHPLRRIDAAITHRGEPASAGRSLSDVHFLVPTGVIADGQTDAAVMQAFEAWFGAAGRGRCARSPSGDADPDRSEHGRARRASSSRWRRTTGTAT